MSDFDKRVDSEADAFGRKPVTTAIKWGLAVIAVGVVLAVVADGMSGERHSSNAELVAQGAANVGAIYGPQSFRTVGISLDGKF